MLFREITAYDDLEAMQSLTQRIWSPRARWHIGDLAWGRHSARDHAAGWRTAVWSEGDTVVAWGWVEPPGELAMAVDPEQPDAVKDVLAWFDEVAIGAERTCMVLDSEDHLVDGLLCAGFRPHMDL